MKMKPLQGFFLFLSLVVILLLSGGCGQSSKEPETKERNPNLAYYWVDVALEGTARDTNRFSPRPTVTSRILALAISSMYDAWSKYDARASSIYLNTEKRPTEEHTLTNKEIAISYAAYVSLCHYYPDDCDFFRERLANLGFETNTDNPDESTPRGIGILAAQTVIAARLNDGSNETGELNPELGIAYLDYTGYQPTNDPDVLTDAIRWQPKYFTRPDGSRYAPGCLTAHWPEVQPLLISSAAGHRSPEPPALDSEQLKSEIEEVVMLQANMTDEDRALVEFMRDGPSSVQQAGHWLLFAQHVSQRDGHSLDEDMKMFFLVAATAMDAFIACWDTKMHYDYARPYALIHEMYGGKTIRGWTGKGREWADIDGSQWRPYSPDEFLCPAFPAYVSGHSAVSGACGEVLKRFKGNDHFGLTVKHLTGSLTHPEDLGDEVTLSFPTFTDAAEKAGFSRVLGGYHIQVDNVEGLALGRKVAEEVWLKYLALIGEE